MPALDPATELGRRMREVRGWRRLSLRAVAELSGITYGYLAQIERGEKPMNNRRVLEALAHTLGVSPAELTGKPYAPVDPTSNAAHAALEPLEAALTEWWPGEVPDDAAPRPWPAVHADLERLHSHLRPKCDYAGQGEILPALLHDLLVHAADPQHRRTALQGLISAYYAAGNVASHIGLRQLGYVAAERIQRTAEELNDPEWLGLAAWTRAQFVSSLSRARQYTLAVRAAEMPGTRLETRGMGHLTAALAAAVRGDASTASSHLAAADQMAQTMGPANLAWMARILYFGKTNVGIWRISIGVELGDGPKVAETASGVAWQEMPVSRQGGYWCDLGRGLLQDKRTREQGLHAILRAERLAPQFVRNNAFVREAVTDLLGTARRDAGGRELRGLAYRMGVAPTG